MAARWGRPTRTLDAAHEVPLAPATSKCRTEPAAIAPDDDAAAAAGSVPNGLATGWVARWGMRPTTPLRSRPVEDGMYTTRTSTTAVPTPSLTGRREHRATKITRITKLDRWLGHERRRLSPPTSAALPGDATTLRLGIFLF